MSLGLDAALAQARQSWPDRDAYRCRGAALSYAGLYDQARDLAATLTALGVVKGDRVAIAMTKGLEMPVAIQAIWMAGAAFVPLDPSAPSDRLAGVMATCDITVVIGAQRDKRVLESLAERCAFTLIGAEINGAVCAQLAPAPATFQPAENTSDDIAYIMFTSGSTGAPKGMVHTHGSGRAFADMWAELYDLTQEDILFCTVPLHFDFSLADFLATPMRGACTELVPEPVQRFPASLAASLEDSRATIWSTVPFALVHLRERGAAETRDLSHLRWVIYGGEPFAPRQLAAIREVIGAEISNSYGPAELNQVSAYTVPRDHPVDQPIPIGEPTPQARFEVSADGELLVASASMMRGYWQRDDLNAQAFVEINGRRYYRTGDMVRQAEDGLWHFGGRADRQVKLRGYRIELDEVEQALSSHPAVSEAAAVLAADGDSLHGFVMLAPGADVPEGDLRNHIQAQLPAYAVPGRLHVKPDLPRTGTGKINRRALQGELA